MKNGTTIKGGYGFSLIELMIAMTIGLLLLSGLAMIFVNSSDANRELQKTAQQIENGRYAIDLLSQDMHLAGYFGHLWNLSQIPTPATVPPDPCVTVAGNLLSTLWYPVQGYSGTIGATPASDAAPNVSSTSCAALTAANLKPGSDVIVIRRADTNALLPTDSAQNNVFYIQASNAQAEIQVGNGVVIGTDKKADGSAAALFLTNGAVPAPAAPIRRFHVRVYFVAPCSVGTGAGGVCTGAAGEDTIPTLKRLELTNPGNITLVPLVEGIDYLKVEYGIDDLPPGRDRATFVGGDATVDRFAATPLPTDWPNVIAVQLYLLARNTEATAGFTDDKTYTLGSVNVPARNDNFRRHVFAAMMHLTNPAGRRESPDPGAPRLIP